MSSDNIKLKIAFLHEYALLPVYATDGSGAFDIYSVSSGFISPGNPVVFNTGIAVEVPDGYTLLIFSRSGHGFNNDVRLANCVGVIDSDYRGEIKVKLTADSTYSSNSLFLAVGSRIAQGLLVKTPKVEFEVVKEEALSGTVRNADGFGSTGTT